MESHKTIPLIPKVRDYNAILNKDDKIAHSQFFYKCRGKVGIQN